MSITAMGAFVAGIWVGAASLAVVLLALVAKFGRRRWIEYVVVYVERDTEYELARRPLYSASEVARN